MTTLEEYARHSRYSDPGRYGHLLAELPTDVRQLAAVVHRTIVHFKGREFPPERFGEIDHRWLHRLLATDQQRFGTPLAPPAGFSSPRPSPTRPRSAPPPASTPH